MAFRRSIIARAKLIYQQPRVAAPFPHFHRDDNDQKTPSQNDAVFKNPLISDHFQRRLFGTGSNLGGSHGSRNLFQDRRFAIPAGCGPVFVRHMSSLGENVTDVLSDKAADVAAQIGPVANEVSIAAADSSMPVAAIQHLIDYVHCYTGFSWWASIVVTTILIRSVQLPLTIYTWKSLSKTRILLPRLEEMKKEMRNGDITAAEAKEQRKELYKEYGVTPFTPLKGTLITVPTFICFFLAVRNMADNVPSFKEGGAFWFTDLTSTDSMYIFPILTALIYCIAMECKPTAPRIKKFWRVVLPLTIPLTAMLPNALFCYLTPNTLFVLALQLVLKKPGVQEFLGFPIKPAEVSSKPTNENRSATPTLPSKD